MSADSCSVSEQPDRVRDTQQGGNETLQQARIGLNADTLVPATSVTACGPHCR